MRHRHGLTAVIVISLLVLVILGVALFALSGGFADDHPDQINVYCAAGILPPVEQAAKRYEQETGTAVVFSTGNSGELREKVRLRGGADLFIPADDSFVEPLKEEGRVSSSLPVAAFRLVIAVQPDDPKGIASLDDLLADGVRYGVCVPEAGAGKRTRAALEAAGAWDRVWQGKKSSHGTVTEAATNVKLGHLDAAIVWDAVALQRGLKAVEVPELAGGVATITAAVVKGSDRSAAAADFARFLAASDKGQPAFAAHHYRPVPRDAAPAPTAYQPRPVLRLHIGTVSEPAVRKTLDEFAAEQGVQVQTKYMGCGDLQSAMLAGDVPDAYLACDISYRPPVDPLKGEPQLVSKMDLAILVKPGNPKGITALDDLLRDDVEFHVSNPKNTAMGGLTERLFREAVGQWEGLKDKGMVMQSLNGHTMALQLAQSAGHDAAIAYAVNAKEYVERGELEIVPIDHPQANATQGLWKNRRSPNAPLVDALLERLRSEPSGARYREAGFRFLSDEAPASN